MKPLTGCSRIALIILSIITLIIGLAILTIGLIIAVGFKYYSNLVGDIIQPGATTPIAAGDLSFVADAGIPLIVFGVIITLVTFFGCLAGCLENRCMLLSYGVMLLILILLQIIAAILLFGGFVLSKMEEEAKRIIKEDYRGIEDNGTYTDLLSFGVDAVMRKLECCGLYNYSDFEAAVKWNRDYTFADGTTLKLQIPLSCCKTDKDPECAKNPTDENSFRATSCWPKVVDHYNGYKGWGVAFFVIVIILEVILILLTVYLVWAMIQESDNGFKQNNRMYVPGADYPQSGGGGGVGGGGAPRRSENRHYGTHSDRGSQNSRSFYTPDWYSQERKYTRSPLFNNTFDNSNFQLSRPTSGYY